MPDRRSSAPYVTKLREIAFEEGGPRDQPERLPDDEHVPSCSESFLIPGGGGARQMTSCT